ncbi:GspE/PulE family protein [Comamonadaceae bacterium M7527]|nr:GspE/PulE family protein [Comamonadaceae bacterium M7527]
MDYHSHAAHNPVSQANPTNTWQQLLGAAVAHRASDIHLEPTATGLGVRFRIDGVLVSSQTLGLAPVHTALKDSLRSYIKVSAAMDIAQQRLPQDGHWTTHTSDQQAHDCRIATMPTALGEKLVIRLLASNRDIAALSTLGYNAQQLRTLQHGLQVPHGLILMTGPTGCGKTTSIYSALQTLDLTSVNVCTIEDPVELLLDGVHQVQVNEALGLGFASALRALLRQDPDVIVVGEIRDANSASMAVHAAQTGHLVISTLHANNATQAITRLIHMGIAPVDLASSLQLITAQRLVRRLCPHCKQAIAINKQQRRLFESHGLSIPVHIYKPADPCSEVQPQCTCIGGYLGRVGIFQMLPITDAMTQFLLDGHNEHALASAAAKAGVNSLAHHALARIAQGDTSWAEAARHVALGGLDSS